MRLLSVLFLAAGTLAFGQTAGQDMKGAGHDIKGAAKETGKATRKTAHTVKSKTKHAVHKGSSKVANKTESTRK